MTCKPYDIPKTLIWEAWLHVKANQGAAGSDAETIAWFEQKLGDNLYKLWNRRSSGSYLPPPVKAVPIVYCKDINRIGDHPKVQFTFLGYTFRPRKALDKYGRVYVNFSPAVSRDALKAMRQTIRGWHLQLKSDKSLADLSAMFAPEGLAAILWPLARVGAHAGVAEHEPVSDPLADAQAQEAGRPQNKGCRNAQAAGAEQAGCVHSWVPGISVVGWMMGAG